MGQWVAGSNPALLAIQNNIEGVAQSGRAIENLLSANF